MSQGHCHYCDLAPLRDAERTPSIEHFHPKGGRHPEFWPLVATWTNLYLACGHCNAWKREQWSDSLLAPDADDYAFEQFFDYDPMSGLIMPSPDATDHARQAAETTLSIRISAHLEAGPLRRAGSCPTPPSPAAVGAAGTIWASVLAHARIALHQNLASAVFGWYHFDPTRMRVQTRLETVIVPRSERCRLAQRRSSTGRSMLSPTTPELCVRRAKTTAAWRVA